MHLLMILLALGLAWLIRLLPSCLQCVRRSLFSFLCPPLLLLMTAIAIVSMGPSGQMLGLKASWVSYVVALGYLVYVSFLLLKLAYQAYRQDQRLSIYPQQLVLDKRARILETDFPYIAQIGFWQCQLVVSRGLLKILNEEQLKAVLAHEQAHAQYHDTFWCFWLGWLRSATNWLPKTEELWQEILLLRELRADHWGAKQVNSLVLAETLFTVAQQVNNYAMHQPNLSFSVQLNDTTHQRLAQRIEALLSEDDSPVSRVWYWQGIICSLVPLLTIFLHN